jgi:hypothetical protein
MNTEVPERLARAREYLIIAESTDAKREAYIKAADEIIAAQKEDPTLSFVEIDERLGRSKSGKYSGDLVRWRTSSSTRSTPFGGPDHRVISDSAAAKRMLRDPDQRRKVMAELPSDTRAEIVEEMIEDDEDDAVSSVADSALERREMRRPRVPRKERQTQVADLKGLLLSLGRIKYELLQFVHVAKNQAHDLDEESRDHLRTQVADIVNILTWLDEGLKGESLEETLEKILAQEN